MFHQAQDLVFYPYLPHQKPKLTNQEEEEKLERKGLNMYSTCLYEEDGTAFMFYHDVFNVDVAAELLKVYFDPRGLHPVEMKYDGNAAPDVAIYLLRNRVMRKENPALWKHFKIREKGPVVLHYMTNKSRNILSPPNLEGPIEVIKPRALRIHTHEPCSASPPIPGVFREPGVSREPPF